MKISEKIRNIRLPILCYRKYIPKYYRRKNRREEVKIVSLSLGSYIMAVF